MDFGKLYKTTANNKVYIWHIVISTDNDIIQEICEHGEINGKIVSHTKEVTVAKGKKTLLEQAIQDANRKFINKKEKEGYVSDIDNVNSKMFVRPMLAHPFQMESLKKRGKTIKFPCYEQPKLDGIRCISYSENGNIIMESRKGVPFRFMNHIRDEISPILNNNPNLYLDGELYTQKIPFEEISGLVRLKEEPSAIQFNDINKIQYCVYDCIVTNKMSTTFENRNKILQQLLAEMKYIVHVDTNILNTPDDIIKTHDNYIANGFEGLMLRNIDSVYEIDKRSKNLQKFKNFREEEFTITGFHQGTGNNKGCIVWECVTKDNKPFSADAIGTRLHRQNLFKNGDNYIGSLLTVKFFEYTKDGVPRFPKGKDVRDNY